MVRQAALSCRPSRQTTLPVHLGLQDPQSTPQVTRYPCAPPNPTHAPVHKALKVQVLQRQQHLARKAAHPPLPQLLVGLLVEQGEELCAIAVLEQEVDVRVCRQGRANMAGWERQAGGASR